MKKSIFSVCFSKIRKSSSNNVCPSRLRVESLEERKLLSADGALLGAEYIDDVEVNDEYVAKELDETPVIDLSAISGEVTGVLGANSVLADVATIGFNNPTFVCTVNGEATDAVKVEDGQLIYVGELSVAESVRASDFTVVVSASEGDASAEASFDLTVKRFSLAAPTNVVFSDSAVTWDAVENAERYTVDLYANGARVSRTETYASTFCNFKDLADDVDYSVVVYANAYQAVTSRSAETYAAQASIELSADSGSVISVFDENVVMAEVSVTNLDDPTFVCTIDGQETDAFKVEDGNLVYVGGLIVVDNVRSQDYEVTITAQDGDDSASATFVLKVNRFKLAPAANVTVDGVSDSAATISWDAIENAERYTVDLYTDGERLGRYETKSETSLTLSDLDPETEYVAKVYANAYQGITSVAEIDFVTGEYVEPSIELSAESASVVAIEGQGDVLAEVSTEGLDDPTFVCKVNGEATDAVAVRNGQLVYVGELSVAVNVRSSIFTVEVEACDADNTVSASIDVTVNRFNLDKPVNVVVGDVAENSATFSWDAVEGAEFYVVAVFADGELVNRFGSGSKTTKTVYGLDASTAYEARVYANAYQANTAFSAVVEFTTAGEEVADEDLDVEEEEVEKEIDE